LGSCEEKLYTINQKGKKGEGERYVRSTQRGKKKIQHVTGENAYKGMRGVEGVERPAQKKKEAK